MGCHKQSELNSLRAQVKRLEDGREVRNLNDELQRKNRRIESLLKDNERLKGEIYRLQQDNSSLQEDLSIEQFKYEAILKAYERLNERTTEAEFILSDYLSN
jgi:predicted  nucleic acid-binding Zn-ribbon protein